MAEELLSSVNAEPAATVEPQAEPTPATPAPAQESAESVNGGAAPAAEVKKPVQTAEENARFAAVRREAEIKAKDALVAEIYGAQGIKTYEQYQKALAAEVAAERAAAMNASPELYAELTETKRVAQEAFEKLSAYEQKEQMEKQAAELAADPRLGKFFKTNEAEIRSFAEQFHTDLATARTIVLENKYAEPDVESIEKAAVQKYLEGLKNNNKPVEGSGAPPVTIPSEPKTFEDARKGAMAYLRQNI